MHFLRIFLASFVTAASSIAMADEQMLGYIPSTETLPQSQIDGIETVTMRNDKVDGGYHGIDARSTINYGFTDRIQLSVSAQARAHDFDQPSSDSSFHHDDNDYEVRFDGGALGLKYTPLSPFLDPIGLSFIIEPGFSSISKVTGAEVDQVNIDTRIIAQKNFLNDQLIFLLSLDFNPEWQRFESNHERYANVGEEIGAGSLYRFASNFYAGVETRYHLYYRSESDLGLPLEDVSSYAFFLGPALHYGAERWWATLSATPQLVGNSDSPKSPGALDLKDHERYEVRFKLGYNF